MTSLANWRGHHLSATNIRHLKNADPYHGIYGGARPGEVENIGSPLCDPKDAGKLYAKEVQECINYDTNGQPAALFLEGLQGVGGLVQWADGYLEECFKIAKKNNMITICDEVQTGFGRFGSHYWGFKSQIEDEANYPDAITMAKSMGNGFPMSGIACTEELGDAFFGKLTFNTYGANPLACVVGETVMDIIEDENLSENVDKLGKMLISGMNVLKHKYEKLGDVRGRGFMIGIEIVESKETKMENLADAIKLWDLLREEGVLVGKGGFYGNCLRIQPPMCWNKEDVKFFLEVLDLCLEKIHK